MLGDKKKASKMFANSLIFNALVYATKRVFALAKLFTLSHFRDA